MKAMISKALQFNKPTQISLHEKPAKCNVKNAIHGMRNPVTTQSDSGVSWFFVAMFARKTILLFSNCSTKYVN